MTDRSEEAEADRIDEQMHRAGGAPDGNVSMTPSFSVAVKLASVAVHAEELISPTGAELDAAAIRGLLADPDVAAYLDTLSSLALLPVKR